MGLRPDKAQKDMRQGLGAWSGLNSIWAVGNEHEPSKNLEHAKTKHSEASSQFLLFLAANVAYAFLHGVKQLQECHWILCAWTDNAILSRLQPVR